MKIVIVWITVICTLLFSGMPVLAETPNNETALQSFLGTYRGSYYAAQGHTGLTLNVYQDENAAYKAQFHFYALPHNPTVPTGTYLNNVSYNHETETFRVEGYEWIERPAGYVFVLLDGVYSGNKYQGSVNHSGRKYSFELAKQIEENAPSLWAEETIDHAILEGFVPLELQNNYTKPITRAQFTHLAIAAIILQTGQTMDSIIRDKGKSVVSNSFTDTDDPYILQAHTLEIIRGYGNGLFRPENSITREQAAIILRNMAAVFEIYEPNGAPMTFSDEHDISEWAKESVAFISASTDPGSQTPIMNGYNRLFDPQNNYTKEQAIITIYRLISFVSSQQKAMD